MLRSRQQGLLSLQRKAMLSVLLWGLCRAQAGLPGVAGLGVVIVEFQNRIATVAEGAQAGSCDFGIPKSHLRQTWGERDLRIQNSLPFFCFSGPRRTTEMWRGRFNDPKFAPVFEPFRAPAYDKDVARAISRSKFRSRFWTGPRPRGRWSG